jgi:hypothetical protein
MCSRDAAVGDVLWGRVFAQEADASANLHAPSVGMDSTRWKRKINRRGEAPVIRGADKTFWTVAGGYTLVRFNSRFFHAATSV